MNELGMADAYGRRIVRDLPKMPSLMRGGFRMIFIYEKISPWLLSLLLFVGFYFVTMVIKDSPLLGGRTFISDNSYFLYMTYMLPIILFFKWIFPILLNSVFGGWYYRTRQRF